MNKVMSIIILFSAIAIFIFVGCTNPLVSDFTFNNDTFNNDTFNEDIRTLHDDDNDILVAEGDNEIVNDEQECEDNLDNEEIEYIAKASVLAKIVADRNGPWNTLTITIALGDGTEIEESFRVGTGNFGNNIFEVGSFEVFVQSQGRDRVAAAYIL